MNELSCNKISKFRSKIYLNRLHPSSSHTFSVRKMLDESSFSFFDSLMVFMTHYLSIESPNGIIFELEKKSSGRLSKNENLSGRVP